MIHYSKPMQNEARYMRAMTKQKLRQYLKEKRGTKEQFYVALINVMVKMNSETQTSDEMYGALLIEEFINHSVPSYYLDNAELKEFLMQTECIKDFHAVKDFIFAKGIPTEDSSDGAYITVHVRVPEEKDAYTYFIGAVKDNDRFVVMSVHGNERKVYIISTYSKGKPTDELKLLLNLIYYVLAFPDALVDGKPKQAEPDAEHAKAGKYTLHTDSRVIEHEEGEKQHRVTHFRRGHFRHLSSDYYKNKKGQVIFIHAALIKGTAAKTVIG